MVAVPDRVQQLGDELADAVAVWVARSAESGAVLGGEARRAERVARQRAGQALRALRGQPPTTRWPIVAAAAGAGFVAGVLVGHRPYIKLYPGSNTTDTDSEPATSTPVDPDETPGESGTPGAEDEPHQ